MIQSPYIAMYHYFVASFSSQYNFVELITQHKRQEQSWSGANGAEKQCRPWAGSTSLNFSLFPSFLICFSSYDLFFFIKFLHPHLDFCAIIIFHYIFRTLWSTSGGLCYLIYIHSSLYFFGIIVWVLNVAVVQDCLESYIILS